MKDKLFKVTKCIKDHTGHLTGSSVYGSYPTVRIMSESTQNKVNQLEGVGASRRRVADVIGEETGNIIIREECDRQDFNSSGLLCRIVRKHSLLGLQP
jgi:hypothetical protein